MNLHGIAGPIIAAVNPFISVVLSRAGGYSTAADGTRTPCYAPNEVVEVQLQGMSEAELKQMEKLNIGGILRKVYYEGQLSSLDRNAASGGDLLSFNNYRWLVVHILEQWPDWCAVVIQQQEVLP